MKIKKAWTLIKGRKRHQNSTHTLTLKRNNQDYASTEEKVNIIYWQRIFKRLTSSPRTCQTNRRKQKWPPGKRPRNAS